jgi:hypothetical protein
LLLVRGLPLYLRKSLLFRSATKSTCGLPLYLRKSLLFRSAPKSTLRLAALFAEKLAFPVRTQTHPRLRRPPFDLIQLNE